MSILKNRSMKVLYPLTFTLFTGCVSKPYVQPTTNFATLSLETSSSQTLTIMRLPGKMSGYHCSAEKPEGIANLNLNMFVIGADKTGNHTRFTIPAAGENFRFLIVSLLAPTEPSKVNLCFAHYEFAPEQGANYQAIHSADTSYCSIDIHKIGPQGNKELVPTIRRLPPCVLKQLLTADPEESIREKYEKHPELFQ